MLPLESLTLGVFDSIKPPSSHNIMRNRGCQQGTMDFFFFIWHLSKRSNEDGLGVMMRTGGGGEKNSTAEEQTKDEDEEGKKKDTGKQWGLNLSNGRIGFMQ